MKRFLLKLLIAFTPIYLFGQIFAPIGAEWHYDKQYAFSSSINFIKFTSEKDTIIANKICKKIIKVRDLQCYGRSGSEYVYSNNDTVYFWNKDFEEFQILYAFNANPNDFWDIMFKDENQITNSVRVIVDEVSTIEINGHVLKKLFVTYLKNTGNTSVSYSSIIIERIGDLSYMFNWIPLSSEMACDISYTNGLRCYRDLEMGNYSTGISTSCDYTETQTNTNEIYSSYQINISPIPTKNYILINTPFPIEAAAQIIDLNGSILADFNITDTSQKIDLSHFKKGIYILVVKKDDLIIASSKIIKE